MQILKQNIKRSKPRGEATRLAYMTDEAKEGRDAFLEKRKPNFEKKWIP